MSSTTMVERYVASMVLGGVGDAMGFKNAGWEFCMSGAKIHENLEKLGGIEKLRISLPKWRVSDDTVMQLATGNGIISHGNSTDKESLYLNIAYFYKECMNDMQARSPGMTCRGCAYALQPQNPKGYQQPFDSHGGGCGAAMRAMCIGLRYPTEGDLDDLIACSVESGRMTHHHPTGYLGALAAALFVAYSLQGKPVREWGAGLMSVLPKALEYVEQQGRYVEENRQAWSYFTQRWTDYLKERKITDGQSDPKFPKKYGVKERDAFYNHVSFSGWGGASGHDAPMIAYDALLGAGDCWVELCERGVLHGGDNDSTGTIAGACFGAMYGFNGVPKLNYQELEYRERLSVMGLKLYELSHPEETLPENILDTIIASVVVEDTGEASSDTSGTKMATGVIRDESSMDLDTIDSKSSKVKFATPDKLVEIISSSPENENEASSTEYEEPMKAKATDESTRPSSAGDVPSENNQNAESMSTDGKSTENNFAENDKPTEASSTSDNATEASSTQDKPTEASSTQDKQTEASSTSDDPTEASTTQDTN